jgi:SAM-dependent methyltransferase
MSRQKSARRRPGTAYDFLIVDDFLRDLMQARCLKTALELGLVDYLLDSGPRSPAEIQAALRLDARGLEFLLEQLLAHQVMDKVEDKFRVHARFLRALEYRDLLEAKLDFAGFVAADLLELHPALIADPLAFMRRSRLFSLFDYGRCFDGSHENYERTRTWMRFTSALTRYEARACLDQHNFAPYHRMLDVGGNSGEFALQACRRHAGLAATVMDLPLVCEIAQEHVLPHPERDRIAFLAADVRTDPLPAGYDLVVFKSMLHDWPEEEARRFVRAAAEALEPGGTLLIFERSRIDAVRAAASFATLPVLMFFRAYRDPGFYRQALADCGLQDIAEQEVLLELPFFIMTATKPPTARSPSRDQPA